MVKVVIIGSEAFAVALRAERLRLYTRAELELVVVAAPIAGDDAEVDSGRVPHWTFFV